MSRRKNKIDHVNDTHYAQHLHGRNRQIAVSGGAERTALINRMLTRVLIEYSTNRFKWENLPPTVNPRFLEMTLLSNALVVFYDDPDYGYLALRGAGAGEANMYDDPTRYIVYGNSFVNKYIHARDCVPIWANYMRVPDLDIIFNYASRIAEIDRTLEINAINARRTKIVVAGENQRLSHAQINRMIDSGEGTLFLTPEAVNNFPISNVDLTMDKEMLEKLHIYRARVWAECMGLLGINNANQEKKERLVSGETEANNEQVLASRAVALNSRREAVDRINEKYGLEIKVSYNIDNVAELATRNEEQENQESQNVIAPDVNMRGLDK